MKHPAAEKQFDNDIKALEWADTCILVLPCGRSAHTEAGWTAGSGKKVVVYIPEIVEPELMYKLFDAMVSNTYDLLRVIDPNKMPKKLTKEEMDILWEESGRQQESMMAEMRAANKKPFIMTPMLERMLDGSDIVDNDNEED